VRGAERFIEAMRQRGAIPEVLASILRGGWRGLGLIPSYVAGW
jgi:hypothetical protein